MSNIYVPSNNFTGYSKDYPEKLEQNEDDIYNFGLAHITRQDIESFLPFRIRDVSLYQRAFIHKSIHKYVKRANYKILDYYKESNERLEYLGDAVLNLIVGKYLFNSFLDKNEGFLTRIRTKLVKSETLAYFASQLGLGNYILMSQHVISLNGRTNPRLLEDAFEALLGAIYLDKGIDVAEAFVCHMIERYIDFTKVFTEDNYKDIISRHAQANSLSLPEYKQISVEGPANNRLFSIGVFIDDEEWGRGVGKSKKIAEQMAARAAIEKRRIVDKRNF